MQSRMLKTDSLDQESSVYPHMTQGYPIPPEMKMAVAKSHARKEEVLVLQSGLLPYTHTAPETIAAHRKKSSEKDFRIKIGYVSASMRSKAIIYLAQNIFTFHDRSKYEVHVFAACPADSAEFIEKAMYGVDWRAKVKHDVEYFHDVHTLDVKQLANKIYNLGIHILLDWDGYSNNGLRPTGLFAMQPAPLAANHQVNLLFPFPYSSEVQVYVIIHAMQEFLGTMGGSFTQYIVTDKFASPKEAEKFHTEKFIW
jgi:protein O-GlcNAc transferase